jgi:hypothetical protein
VVLQAARIAHVACLRFHTHAPCSFWCSLDPTTTHTATSLQSHLSRSRLDTAERELFALYGDGRVDRPKLAAPRQPQSVPPSDSSSSSSSSSSSLKQAPNTQAHTDAVDLTNDDDEN